MYFIVYSKGSRKRWRNMTGEGGVGIKMTSLLYDFWGKFQTISFKKVGFIINKLKDRVN